MNELEFIRSQVALEHRHLLAVARTCIAALRDPNAAPDAFLTACADYLVRSGRRWLRRVRAARWHTGAHTEGRTRMPARAETAPETADLITCEQRLEELEHVMRAGAERSGPDRLVSACSACARALATALDQPAAGLVLADTWTGAQLRRFAAVDADSILEERAAWDAVVRALPPGLTLHGPDAG